MSLPNGSVPMAVGECSICEGGATGHGPLGLNCGGCGHHFHIGREILIRTEPIFCPRCEGACPPFDITERGEKVEEAQEARSDREQEILDACLSGGDLEEEVIEAVRAVAETRRSMDPNYWINVCLRESWKHEHGDYEGWDKAARASGNDPAEFAAAEDPQ